MTKKTFLIPLLIFALIGTLHAEENQYEDKKITSIVIEAENAPSNAVFQPRTVESKLKIKVGERFSQSAFDQDLKNLSKDYDRVDPQITTDRDDIQITLKVWLRPLISEVTISGDYHYNSKKLKKELGVHPYTLFNRNAFNKGFHKLRAFYLRKGYFETQLDYKVVKNTDKNEVAIEIMIDEGRSGRIHSVSFEGATAEEISQLKEVIHIKKFNPFISWLTQRGIYHEEMIDYDTAQVLDFFRNEGYANAKVEIDVIDSDEENRIGIQVIADKGELFKVGSVTFEGNQEFNDQEIESKILIAKGDPYSPKKIQDTVNAITEFYGKKGYIDVAITYEPHLIENENAYTLKFGIDEGAAYKVGLIKIMGNNHTISKVILRETHLEPGNTFDTKMLEATRKRLENVGYYKHVNVYPSSVSSTQSIGAPIRDVNIQVQETPTGSMGMNAGYSTVDTVYGGLELSEKNFNLMGLAEIPSKGISALRGGGEYFSLKSSIGLKLTDYSMNWMKPYFFDTSWTIGVALNKNRSKVQSNNYNIETFTSTFNSFYPINAFVDFNAFYRLRDTNLNVTGPVSVDLRMQEKNNGIISSVGVGLQYETRNSMHRPTQGLSSSLSCEYAGIGGQFYYFNFGYNNSLYVPVGPFIAKSKADFNFIKPISRTKPDTVPVGERFFLATDISQVRGYKPFAIGPKAGNEPIGGNSAVILSQEIMYGVVPKFLDAFAFVDAGSLWEEPFKVQQLRASVGVGIRIIANPNIPVMLGWGYPINPQSGKRAEQTQSIFFSLAGRF